MDNGEFNDFTLLGGYNNGGGGYAQADFGDADDTRPPAAYMEALGGNSDAIQGIVQQTLQRHTNELLPNQTQSPRLGPATSNWRKTLRDIMIRQDEQLIRFLYRPSTEQGTVGPVEKALRRYSLRHDIDPTSTLPLKDLLQDPRQQELIQSQIEHTLQQKGPSNLQQVKAQATALYELYRQIGEQILTTETMLKGELEKMDKIQKRVGMMMELKQNEALPDVIQAFEKYLKVSFDGTTIEPQYRTLLQLYQKHNELREAIQLLRVPQTSSDPLCPICTTESVTRVLVPCGHTFCQGCATRLIGQCGVCRGAIRDRMKVYFT